MLIHLFQFLICQGFCLCRSGVQVNNLCPGDAGYILRIQTHKGVLGPAPSEDFIKR
jgi:hypothetical protein